MMKQPVWFIFKNAEEEGETFCNARLIRRIYKCCFSSNTQLWIFLDGRHIPRFIFNNFCRKNEFEEEEELEEEAENN